MIVRHYLHTDPAVAISYLFGCGGKAVGAVVDPVAAREFYQRQVARAWPHAGAPGARRHRPHPDHVLILPGAYAGSVCGRALSGTPFSSIGFERRHNGALGVTDREELVTLMLRDIPPRPPHAAETRAINMGAAVADYASRAETTTPRAVARAP